MNRAHTRLVAVVGRSGIYVSTRTAPVRRVFGPVNPRPYVRQPAWSPDGGWIAFAWYRSHRNSDIWLVPAEGGAPRPITSGKAVDHGPAWLPPATG